MITISMEAAFSLTTALEYTRVGQLVVLRSHGPTVFLFSMLAHHQETSWHQWLQGLQSLCLHSSQQEERGAGRWLGV